MKRALADNDAFLLVRVDDRLLHGQVVFGWGMELNPGAYLIVDDEVAGDSWEKESFEAAAPPEAPVSVLTLDYFSGSWPQLPDRGSTVVLIRGLAQLSKLVAAGFDPGTPVNLGGLHANAASRELISYLHLTPEDETILRSLVEAGFPLEARDLPSTEPVSGRKLIGL